MSDSDSLHDTRVVCRGASPAADLSGRNPTGDSTMRKQYHLRTSSNGLLAWDVDRLVELTTTLPRREIPLRSIRELHEPFWFGEGSESPTCRAVADHARLIQTADLRYPIILSADGRVMDGMHRVAKAYLEGRATILAVQLVVDPEPDYVGVDEDALPYDDEE
jgi:hypothetical protein